MRRLIKETDPGVVEEWKWMGTPVWSQGGVICTGESDKSIVKLTFARGASLKIRPGSSTPVSTATHAARSTSGKAKKWTNRLQGARSRSDRPQQVWQVESFGGSEVLLVARTPRFRVSAALAAPDNPFRKGLRQRRAIRGDHAALGDQPGDEPRRRHVEGRIERGRCHPASSRTRRDLAVVASAPRYG